MPSICLPLLKHDHTETLNIVNLYNAVSRIKMSNHCSKYFVKPDCDFPMVNYSFKEQSAGISVRQCVSMHACVS